MSADSTSTSTSTETGTAGQARQQPGQPQVRVRVDDRNLTTSYANSFRTNATAEEMMIDFGINVVATVLPTAYDGPPPGEIVFNAQNRIFLNYYTATRLMLTLGQIVAQHETLFGELKLNAADRMRKKA